MPKAMMIAVLAVVCYGMTLGHPAWSVADGPTDELATNAQPGDALTEAEDFMIEPMVTFNENASIRLTDTNAWRDAFYNHIPEPASAVLLMLGAFMIFHGTRRRSQKGDADPAEG